MKEDDVEFALERRDVGEKLVEIGAIAKRQDVKSALRRSVSGIDADSTARTSAGEAREKFLARFGFLRVVRERKFFGGEPGLEVAAHGGPGKIMNVGGDAMRGKNGEAFAVRVDEGHHDALERSLGIDFA